MGDRLAFLWFCGGGQSTAVSASGASRLGQLGGLRLRRFGQVSRRGFRPGGRRRRLDRRGLGGDGIGLLGQLRSRWLRSLPRGDPQADEGQHQQRTHGARADGDPRAGRMGEQCPPALCGGGLLPRRHTGACGLRGRQGPESRGRRVLVRLRRRRVRPPSATRAGPMWASVRCGEAVLRDFPGRTWPSCRQARPAGRVVKRCQPSLRERREPSCPRGSAPARSTRRGRQKCRSERSALCRRAHLQGPAVLYPR